MLYKKKVYYYFGLVIIILTLHTQQGYTAVTQILNEQFIPNPAKLNRINQSQLMLGAVIINPHLNYTGSSNGILGVTESDVKDALAYLQSGYRINNQWVVGFNATPTSYAHINWPEQSFIAKQSTQTKELYYRFGIQSSYQLTNNTAMGLGINIEDNINYCINFAISNLGNQKNCVHGLNYTGDTGIYYKLNNTNYLTLALTSQVNTYGHGVSKLETIINNDLSLNITQAAVIYAGAEHFISKDWYFEEKIYWSGWSIQKNLNFTNTTSGSYIIPTNLKDVWSFQLATCYSIKPKLSLLMSTLFETNPAPIETNALGYPLASSYIYSLGFDFEHTTNSSLQFIYTYGAFTPYSRIQNNTNQGVVHAFTQAITTQIIYKT